MPKCEISLKSRVVKKCIKNLKKKFPKAEEDFVDVFKDIETEPSQGSDPIPGFNRTVWKKRFQNSSSNKGKSGGFRVIFYWDQENHIVYPLFIYSKNEMENIPTDEIIEALKTLEEEKK